MGTRSEYRRAFLWSFILALAILAVVFALNWIAA